MSTVAKHDDDTSNCCPSSNANQKDEYKNALAIQSALSPVQASLNTEDYESLENGSNESEGEKFGALRLMSETDSPVSNDFSNPNPGVEEKNDDQKVKNEPNNEKNGQTDVVPTQSTKSPNHHGLETSKLAKPKEAIVLNENNQRLIQNSKHRIRERFDELEHRMELQVDRKQLQISDGDLSLEDLGSSIDTVASNSTDRELAQLTQKLRLKEDEIIKLSKFRSRVELELDDLTASLFEEANRMVWEAKTQRAKAEKALKEANMKIDVLQAEVKALKVLVLTSAPTVNSRTLPSSAPNQRSSPFNHNLNSLKSSLTPKSFTKSSKTGGFRAILQRASLAGGSGRVKSASTSECGVVSGLVSKAKHAHHRTIGCKRSPSNYELGEESAQTVLKDGTINQQVQAKGRIHLHDENISISGVGEIDPLFYEEFIQWRRNPKLDLESSEFMKRLYQEEIRPAFNFKNQALTQRLVEAISHNNVIIELNTGLSVMAKKCALLELAKICKHRIKLDDEWLNISQLARDRISAVCDLFCYLRYIQQGLVKSESSDVYWELIRRRRNVALSKLGFSCL